MLSEDRYFKTLTPDELWQRYCGFLDLSIGEFMDIQKELLMDEIERVADSPLGKKIMGNQKPQSVEEFRRMVPLTNYDDYEPYLSEQQEDVLAVKPHFWCHSAGRGGRFKWFPHTSEFMEKVVKACLAGFILASADRKGQINISPGLKGLTVTPPPPYASGYMFQTLAQYFTIRFIPDLEKTESLELLERIQLGFQIALKDGVDVIGAIASILVGMAERMTGQMREMKFSPLMLHPNVVRRLLGAWLRSKREKRKILPKDLWPAKAIMTGGVDTSIYKDEVARFWGSEPYEYYVCTEAYFLALQDWKKKGMIFIPDVAFLEFIPYEPPADEGDREQQTATVLLDEVKTGELYELVITQFYGMPLMRYRMKDLFKVTVLRNEETGVNLPNVVFQRRVDEAINLGGLCWLDEKTIWQAIANTGVKYVDWVACKEYEGKRTFLRIYLELKEKKEAVELENLIDQQLEVIDTDYKDVSAYLDVQSVRVTLLPTGTFRSYIEEKRREGADLAHLKPTHIDPSDRIIQRLLQLGEAKPE